MAPTGFHSSSVPLGSSSCPLGRILCYSSPGQQSISHVMASLDVQSDVALDKDDPVLAAAANSSAVLHAHGIQPHAGAAVECSSVTEVIDLIPFEYHDAVHTGLLELSDAAIRFENLRSQCAWIDSNIKSDHLGLEFAALHPPTIQISKATWSSLHKEMEKLEADFKEAVFAAQWQALVAHIHIDESGQTVPTISHPMEETDGYDVPTLPHIMRQYESLVYELPVMALKIINLSHTCIINSHKTKEHKHDLKEKSTASAPDFAAMDKKSLSKYIQNEVKHQLASVLKPKKDKKTKAKTSPKKSGGGGLKKKATPKKKKSTKQSTASKASKSSKKKPKKSSK
ncbi:hypothetical protein EDD16DRAFT_1527244 [Pisolithus croceorrhizus]|nr:hypothetical protein EDD16DRAFT_1527244 [Pisolithus croceorrhizus]